MISLVLMLTNFIFMSFLEKFKGKTTIMNYQEVGGILGRVSSQPITPPIKNINSSFSVGLPPKMSNLKKIKSKGSHNISKDSSDQSRIQKINPFSVSNPFYLDESQREVDQAKKRQKQMKEKLERQQKIREEIQQRMVQFERNNKKQFSKKQWIRLGGLGPNIGGQEWEKKKQMHSKMLKFAAQIRMINFERLKSVPMMSYSHLTKDSKKDARTRAIEYSRSVPRPSPLICEKHIENIPRSQSKEEISQLQILDQNHQKYMSLMKRI